MGDDRAEILTGKVDWSSGTLEATDKKELNEISGETSAIPTRIINSTTVLSFFLEEIIFPALYIQYIHTSTLLFCCLCVHRGHAELLEGHR